jgi:AcrR family transcriptional regulator
VAIVNKKLRRPEGHDGRAAARDRILEAAARLFHEKGVRATGVDTLIAAAGVAKATFYRHFPSKEDLVVAWLKAPSSRWFDRVRAQAEADARSPEETIPLVFQATAEWLEAEGFRGCPYLNTSTEIVDAYNPARKVIRDYLEEVEAWLRDQVAAAGFADSDILGKELQALLAGSISLGVARRTTVFVIAAREAALALLSTAKRV